MKRHWWLVALVVIAIVASLMVAFPEFFAGQHGQGGTPYP